MSAPFSIATVDAPEELWSAPLRAELEALALEFRCTKGQFVVAPTSLRRPSLLCSYGPRSPWRSLPAGIPSCPGGLLLGPDCGFWLTVLGDNDRLVLLNMTRPREAGPCTRDELSPLLDRLPAMQSMLRLSLRLAALEGCHQALVTASSRLPHGYVLLTRDHRVVFANDQARLLLQGRFGLQITGCRLICHDPTVQHYCEDFGRRTRRLPPTLHLRSYDGGADLWIVPERLAGNPAGDAPELALSLVAPSSAWRPEPDTLRALFHLTPAEARVSSFIASGHSIAETAELCGRKLHTVKSQLGQVYKKLGVSRQSELVILLLRTAGL